MNYSLVSLAMICFMLLLLCSSCSHAFGTSIQHKKRSPELVHVHQRTTLGASTTRKIKTTVGQRNDDMPCHPWTSIGIVRRSNTFPFYSTNQNSEEEKQKENDSVLTKNNTNEDKNQKYPINLPSPILLASSMVLAIASTGSIFELSAGDSSTVVLGFVPTLGIAVLGVPLCLFLFYAAIQKGIAETEADDAAYQRGGANKNQKR